MSEVVDRKAETEEKDGDEDLVDRVGATEEVDRTGSTQEDSGTKLILYVHQVEKQSLLKGLPNEPKTYAVGQTIVFGRGENVDIFLNDQSVSRKHMELTSILHQPTKQAVFKVKVISTSLSVTVNNNVIRCGGECFLKTNDVIMIGQLKFTAEIVSGDGDASYLLEFKRHAPLSQMHQPYPPHYQHPQVLQYQPQAIYNPAPIPPYHPQIPDPHQAQLPFGAGYPGMPSVPMAVAGYPPTNLFTPAQVSVQQLINGANVHQIQHSAPPGPTERRQDFSQTRGRMPSENDSLDSNISIEETQPKLSTLEESFEDSHPPKQ